MQDMEEWVSIGVKKAWLAPKEVITETLSEVWISLSERGLKKSDNPSGLIISMAKNKTMNRLRKRNKRSTPNSPHNLVHTLYVHPNQEFTDNMTQLDEEEVPELDLAIELLPTKYGDVLKRYYFEGMTMVEIALDEGVTKQAIAKRIYKAIDLIKGYI